MNSNAKNYGAIESQVYSHLIAQDLVKMLTLTGRESQILDFARSANQLNSKLVFFIDG